MKFREIVWLLNTDDFWITVNGDIETTEHIEGTAQGSFHAIRKYFDYIVDRITPVDNGIEIDLKRE